MEGMYSKIKSGIETGAKIGSWTLNLTALLGGAIVFLGLTGHN